MLDAYEPSLTAAADACAKYVADMEAGAEPYWLTLTGINGCGKTLLLRQVFEQAKRINPGNPANNPIWPPDWIAWQTGSAFPRSRPYCLYFDERTIARRMRAGEYDLPQSLRDDYFVVLDELGVERDPTNFIANAVAAFCENRIRGWTAIGTNFTIKEIAERVDARASSRLIRDNNVLVTIRANDFALRRRSAA